ncbi:hypothetical protein TWF718_002646 [Orbilia javanica]|uniref:Uncharacterized protein n=1 Tax=Orbilia javanica TaxID=47235 RepID=A0AAN8NMK5_9PEZI
MHDIRYPHLLATYVAADKQNTGEEEEEEEEEEEGEEERRGKEVKEPRGEQQDVIIAQSCVKPVLTVLLFMQGMKTLNLRPALMSESVQLRSHTLAAKAARLRNCRGMKITPSHGLEHTYLVLG